MGFAKKAVDKVKQKVKGKPEDDEMSNDGSNDPAQIVRDKIDELEAKLKVTTKKWKAAQDSTAPNADEKEDYWGEIEMNQTMELKKLKDKLKKMAG